MKTKYQTLCDIVAYVKSKHDNPVSELLNMGFTASQLIYEFGFSEENVFSSSFFITPGNIMPVDYPFVLDNYSEFDSELVNRFLLSPEALLRLKEMPVYKEMKEVFKFAKNECMSDIYNDLFNNFESQIPDDFCNTLKRGGN